MATVLGTKRFFQKYAIGKILKNQWTCGPLGFGGARLDRNTSEHQYALQYAIQGGCNIIDTSDYWGTSETLVNRVLSGMIEEKLITRDEIIISKRVKNLTEFNASINADVLFVDKPSKLTLTDFEVLEKLVKSGNIQYYGISSLNVEQDEIQQYLEMAKRISKNHHFQFLQIPFNINEKSLLHAKGLESLNIFTNRPFYTIQNDTVTPILEFPKRAEVTLEENVSYLNGMLNQLISYEKKHPNEFMWGHKIGENLDQIQNWISLKELKLEIEDTLEDMERDHRLLVNDALKNLNLVLECKNEEQVLDVNNQLKELIPGDQAFHSQTLQQKMIQILSGSSKVDSIMVGMRTPVYVKDLLFPLHFRPTMDAALCDRVIEAVQWHDIPFAYSEEQVDEAK